MSLAVEMITFTGSMLCVSASLPQAVKIFKTQKTDALSYTTYIMILLGSLMWIAYGFMTPVYSIIFWNSFSVILCLTILLMKFKNENPQMFENKLVIKANVRYPIYAVLLTITAFAI